mmetsp:Transcript_4126/g.10650  ORF Transcript_4126/g.10650 Transcript_4126/m.10650 type:complete len:162 (-) Transcript_4126:1419-1904(-)
MHRIASHLSAQQAGRQAGKQAALCVCKSSFLRPSRRCQSVHWIPSTTMDSSRLAPSLLLRTGREKNTHTHTDTWHGIVLCSLGACLAAACVHVPIHSLDRSLSDQFDQPFPLPIPSVCLPGERVGAGTPPAHCWFRSGGGALCTLTHGHRYTHDMIAPIPV